MIGRELRRNRNSSGQYLPGIAQLKANARRRACIDRPTTGNEWLMAHVEGKLRARWWPEQVSLAGGAAAGRSSKQSAVR